MDTHTLQAAHIQSPPEGTSRSFGDAIDTLPFEITALIFEFAVSQNVRAAIDLSHVSRGWRDIALRCRVLWNTIEIPGRLDEVLALLEQSRSILIHVILRQRIHYLPYEDLLSLVKPHSHRWRSLSITFQEPVYANITDQFLDTLDTPRLEQISVPDFRTIAFQNLPALKDLSVWTLTKPNILSRPGMFKQLTRLFCDLSTGTMPSSTYQRNPLIQSNRSSRYIGCLPKSSLRRVR